ncbi:MAG TPA: dienelactone hydrolase family protein, partial [Vicinamibacterales bacterium]
MHDRLTAADFDQGLLDLFDQYVHGGIDRRTFLVRAEAFAAGDLTPAMLLARLSPAFADAQQVGPDDARLKGEMVAYPS